ncbi:reverse transcriptase domain-containing protein [Tanacetum coccineum]
MCRFNILEDIQCVGSDTRPPLLDRYDFASWGTQRISTVLSGGRGGGLRKGTMLTFGQRTSYFKGCQKISTPLSIITPMQRTYGVENQIKFSTCTLLAGALTWWNSHVLTISHNVAYAMTWANLRKKMTDKYCPRNEMKKLEAELWNLKVKGTDVIGYNQRFQELALLCVRMFPEESDKIERYVGGLPDMINGNIVASKPKTMLRTKGSLKTLFETIKTNNNKTRDRTLAGPILQGLVKRSHTGDLNPYALNATITTTVRVLQNATNATKLATYARDCRVLSAEMPSMLYNQWGWVRQETTCFE